jgi:hypothetical protein
LRFVDVDVSADAHEQIPFKFQMNEQSEKRERERDGETSVGETLRRGGKVGGGMRPGVGAYSGHSPRVQLNSNNNSCRAIAFRRPQTPISMSTFHELSSFSADYRQQREAAPSSSGAAHLTDRDTTWKRERKQEESDQTQCFLG